jgi:hypothetical protein
MIGSIINTLTIVLLLGFAVLFAWAGWCWLRPAKSTPPVEPAVSGENTTKGQRKKKKQQASEPEPPPGAALPNVPGGFVVLVNAIHVLYGLTVVLGIVLTMSGEKVGLTTAAKFWEYYGLFLGGGVVYSRGLLPGGWMWKVLTNAPNVAQGMLLGNGWNAAAALGFWFFANVPPGIARGEP